MHNENIHVDLLQNIQKNMPTYVKFKYLKKIDEGSEAEIFLVRYIGQEACLKVWKKGAINTSVTKIKNAIRAEVSINKKIKNNSFLLNLFAYSLTQSWILFEKFGKKKNLDGLNLHVLKEMGKLLILLHSFKCTHGDPTYANFLFEKNKIKIIDCTKSKNNVLNLKEYARDIQIFRKNYFFCGQEQEFDTFLEEYSKSSDQHKQNVKYFKYLEKKKRYV